MIQCSSCSLTLGESDEHFNVICNYCIAERRNFIGYFGNLIQKKSEYFDMEREQFDRMRIVAETRLKIEQIFWDTEIKKEKIE